MLTPLALVAAVRLLAVFLVRIESRPGVRLQDPLLDALAPRDCSWLIFAMIYLAIALVVAVLAGHPRELVIASQAYVLMLLSRMCAMYFTALDPPADAIPLVDPLVERLGTGRLLTRDLFFSGHTATLFLLFLSVPVRTFKALVLAATVVVAGCVLVQHVHYTIDVLVAPMFAFASHRAARLAHGGQAASSPPR
ncbi:MAG TPA: phosphatase PAP2-related protein [Polyangiaceae bacterium]|nr:phosphatase PAP2-related protein [Polyangiaceae bacterium]